MLEIRNVHFSYPGTAVLKGIDLFLEDTEICCITGPNGSGKSTLVQCVNGLLKPEEGEIFLDGRPLTELSRTDIARRIAYVPQSGAQLFSTTVFDTVMMGRRPHAGQSRREEDIEIVLDVLIQLDLQDIALRNYGCLSGGQQQRVCIARALAQDTGILLLDEPTSALDISHQLEVMELVQELARDREMTVVMVVHDLNLASRYADRIVLLDRGEIHTCGRPAEVLSPEHLRSVYKLEASITHCEGELFVLPLRRTNDERKDKRYEVYEKKDLVETPSWKL